MKKRGDVARGSRETLQSPAGKQLTAPAALTHSQDLGLLRQGKWCWEVSGEKHHGAQREEESSGPAAEHCEKQQRPGKPRGRGAGIGQEEWHGGRGRALIQMRSARDKNPSAAGRSISISTGGSSPPARCFSRGSDLSRIHRKTTRCSAQPARCQPCPRSRRGAGRSRAPLEGSPGPSPARAAPGAPVRRLQTANVWRICIPVDFGTTLPLRSGRAGRASRRTPGKESRARRPGGSRSTAGLRGPGARPAGSGEQTGPQQPPLRARVRRDERAPSPPGSREAGGARTTGGSAPDTAAPHSPPRAGCGPPPAGPSAAQARSQAEARSSAAPPRRRDPRFPPGGGCGGCPGAHSPSTSSARTAAILRAAAIPRAGQRARRTPAMPPPPRPPPPGGVPEEGRPPETGRGREERGPPGSARLGPPRLHRGARGSELAGAIPRRAEPRRPGAGRAALLRTLVTPCSCQCPPVPRAARRRRRSPPGRGLIVC